MKPNNLDILITSWADNIREIKLIRKTVFVDEQGVPEELEWDGLDAKCIQFIARCGSMVCATARLKPDGQIVRMAVLRPYRNKGTGSALLNEIIQYAINSGLERVYLHAQVQVIGFYQKHGFKAEGDEFLDAGIPHRVMVKICARETLISEFLY